MTTRRRILLAFGATAFAAPLSALAQQGPAKVYRIGVLGLASSAAYARHADALRLGLRELGYIEGKNLVIDFAWAEGRYERLPELAAGLVSNKANVLVTHGTPGARAAGQASPTIPIVIAAIGDAVVAGVVTNEKRPGGNITGMSIFAAEIHAKSLEVLKEVLPRIRRVAVLFNSDNPQENDFRVMEATAAPLKLELQWFGVRSASEFEGAFARMSGQRVEAVNIVSDPLLVANAGAIARLANKHRIPSIGFLDLAEAGGLLGYGVDLPSLWRRAAYFADKILKGAKPGDLPIERATKFNQVVNMRTARALGLSLPQSILIRADSVIE